MVKVRAVFDTNIIIDYLNGITQADDEMSRFTFKAISIITYIEVLVGFATHKKIKEVKTFLNSLEIVTVDRAIADLAVEIRKEYKLKIPDAIVLATAQYANAILVTRDAKDFSHTIPIIRIPYKV